MPRIQDIFDRRFRNEGVYNSASFTIPIETTRCSIVSERGTPATADVWPLRPYNGAPRSQEVTRWMSEISYDDGVTWVDVGGGGMAGGESVHPRTALPINESFTRHWIQPEQNNVPRLIRCRMRIRNRLRCRVHMDITDEPYPPISTETTNTVGHNVTAVGEAGNATSAVTASFTPSGSNTLLLCAFGMGAGTPGPFDVLSSDVDGNRTEVQDVTDDAYVRMAASEDTAPSASAQVITGSVTGGNEVGLGVTATVFTSVDQTTSTDTYQSNSGTGANPSDTAESATGDMVWQAAFIDDNAIEISTGTSRGEAEDIGADAYSMGVATNTGSGTVTIAWTAAASTYGFITLTVNINDSGVAGGVAVKQRGFKLANLGTLGINTGGQLP